jgi:DNA-directed RNA polymerase specialized sigma24 family protein
MVTMTALARAQAGDGEAFRELTDPYRHELQLHCYRILGSVQDAEDMLQETLLAAWRGLDAFEERSSMRSWLYKIATNRCLNALRDSGRRPQTAAGSVFLSPPARTHPAGRAAVAAALPGRFAGRSARCRTRSRGPL